MRIASRGRAVEPPSVAASAPAVVWLDDLDAGDADLTGAKAANLARAARGGLPVLPGFALTTAATTTGWLGPDAERELRRAWDELQGRQPGPVVVRSSSTAEDTGTASMAGQFTSVVGVEGWEGCRRAVDVVLASAAHPLDGSAGGRPMAVLVQPALDAGCGGVLFGLDPVTGDVGHLVVEAVPGGPEALVSGTATAVHATLTPRGRLVGRSTADLGRLLGRSRRHRLAHLAAGAREAFGAPQDVEWAFDRDDRLWLLQSRAVTAVGDAGAHGPVLGPGPVAETFPEPLRELEEDLWVPPLREGVAGALRAIGAVAEKRPAASPVVRTVGGRVAADLELFGIVPRRGAAWRHLNPVRGTRRLLAAWRVGRLRAALPALAGDVLARVDGDLTAVDDLRNLPDAALVQLLARAGQELVALHGHEVLAGMLLRPVPGDDHPSLPALALATVGRGRAAGFDDDALVAREPITLALVPPAVGGSVHLPPAAVPAAAPTVAALGVRDALRLRSRWVQELTARAAEELGRRLASRGVLTSAADVRHLRLDELAAAVRGSVPADLGERRARPAGPPLPVAFRLSASGRPVATRAGTGAEGLAASAGRAVGVACHDPALVDPAGGSVLVVDTLDPRLAAVLGDVAAVVSETGSALSHLAILARELGVPAVVAVPDARRRFAAGSRLLVDGGAGEVRAIPAEVEP